MRSNDAIDRRLLALLRENARESTTTLGRKLGVARTTVQERIARLQANGTISGYTVVLRRDPQQNYAEVTILLSVSHRRQRAVVEQLRDLPEITLCQTVNGEYDLMARAKMAQMEDIHPFLEVVADIPGIDRMKSMVVLSTNFDRIFAEAAATSAIRMGAFDLGEAG